MDRTTEATRRWIGAFVPRRSELRRRSDRIEVGARWVLLLLGLLFLPVALAVGSETTARLEPQVAVQQAERHQVTATVTAEPERLADGQDDAVTAVWRAPVRWIAADGTERVARADVPSGARPGDVAVLWVDGRDRPTPPPMRADQPAAQGVFVTVCLVLAELVVSLLLLAALRWVLDRARLRAWDDAWRRFAGPDKESRR